MKRLMTFAALILCFASVANAQTINYTTIDAPGAVGETSVLTLNNHGGFVGVYRDAAGNYRGFLGRRDRNGIHYTSLDYPGATQTIPAGLTDSGVISGTYFDTSGVQHGFV